MAKKKNKGSLLEDWFGISEEYQMQTKVVTGLLITGIAGIALFKYRRVIRL